MPYNGMYGRYGRHDGYGDFDNYGGYGGRGGPSRRRGYNPMLDAYGPSNHYDDLEDYDINPYGNPYGGSRGGGRHHPFARPGGRGHHPHHHRGFDPYGPDMNGYEDDGYGSDFGSDIADTGGSEAPDVDFWDMNNPRRRPLTAENLARVPYAEFNLEDQYWDDAIHVRRF